jgi:hypothetical protein
MKIIKFLGICFLELVFLPLTIVTVLILIAIGKKHIVCNALNQYRFRYGI